MPRSKNATPSKVPGRGLVHVPMGEDIRIPDGPLPKKEPEKVETKVDGSVDDTVMRLAPQEMALIWLIRTARTGTISALAYQNGLPTVAIEGIQRFDFTDPTFRELILKGKAVAVDLSGDLQPR